MCGTQTYTYNDIKNYLHQEIFVYHVSHDALVNLCSLVANIYTLYIYIIIYIYIHT